MFVYSLILYSSFTFISKWKLTEWDIWIKTKYQSIQQINPILYLYLYKSAKTTNRSGTRIGVTTRASMLMCPQQQQPSIVLPCPSLLFLSSFFSRRWPCLYTSSCLVTFSCSHPLHSSICSWDSSVSSSQNLHVRLVKDLLLFTLTPLIDLALTLIQILLSGSII